MDFRAAFGDNGTMTASTRQISQTPARLAVVIVAAGGSRRMGGGREKQFRNIGGSNVLALSVAAFLRHPATGKVIVVTAADRRDAAETALAQLPGASRVTLVDGGARRQDSVIAGLTAAADSGLPLVAVHDAARPFVPQRVISELIAALDAGADAALPVLPVVDTLKQLDAGRVTATTDRDTLGRAQTPQLFRLADLLARHDNLPSDRNITDDVRLYEEDGSQIAAVTGDDRLMKLTTAADFAILSSLIAGDGEFDMPSEPPIIDIRTGNGFDVHKLGDSSGPVTLGGVAIPHDRGLAAHSDGDVGLHALCDAIFGALSDGDIGSHFPPSDPQWKDADSAAFLVFAKERCLAHGARILHLDLTLICEQPKIGPHRDAMRLRIAELVGLPVERIAVKATTSEKLGFTGRGEGIAAQATATLLFEGG